MNVVISQILTTHSTDTCEERVNNNQSLSMSQNALNQEQRKSTIYQTAKYSEPLFNQTNRSIHTHISRGF